MTTERNLTVLIVEDDDTATELLSSVLALKYPNFLICTANNGRMGLQAFKDNLPSIVITDANMPEMDGMRMVSEILRIRSETRIIFLTAYDDASIKENAVKEGIKIDYYVAKPLNYKKLFCALDDCIQMQS